MQNTCKPFSFRVLFLKLHLIFMKLSLLRTSVTVTTVICSMIAGVAAYGQTVFNPNDVNVEYSSSNPPTQPASGPGKWVKTSRLNWNTSGFKCYIYKGIAFRLKYPKTYVPGNGVKYPLFVFFHGAGEGGRIYDNEYQLYHGGKVHSDAVDAGTFDGYLLYPQCTNPIFSVPELTTILELIEQYLIPQIQVDPFRVISNGLSGGGAATWGNFMRNPKLFAASLPISNAEYNYTPYIKANKFNPIWLFQGALDQNPPAYRARIVRDSAVAAGANFTYTEYPTRGHDCWYQAWAEPDYFPFIKRAHKANPWPENGRTEFCPQEAVSQVIGVTAGFTAYEWRRNDTLIAGATANTIRATSLGKYDCRIRRGTEWSPWSPIPVILKTKTTSISPDPQLATFTSKVLPAPDGTSQVQLKVADGYAAYKWTAANSTTTLSTTSTYMAAPGSYQVTITEKFGCQSTASNVFTVVNANGPNKPDVVSGLIVNKLSATSLKLVWIANANAANPVTNFEIYQATKSGGPYQFVGITDADVRSFSKVELMPGTKYFYVVRAVNNTAAAAISAEVSATTDVDTQLPSSPVNVKVMGTTRSAIAIQWGESDDNAGISKYDIYVNGAKSYTTANTNYTIYNLDYNTVYTIAVKARDLAGNESPLSNQVSARTVMNGLMYKYYVGDWNKLPDFNLVPLEKMGFASNVTLANKNQDEGFAFLWEGYINITTSGSYTFRTNSNDGSRLYINTPYSSTATPLVDNDGVHNAQNKDGTITLAQGVYPIVISYFQKTTTSSIAVSWKRPGSSSFVTIPNSAFTENATGATGIPTAPSALAANAVSYKKVSLNWTDNSNNETAFEVARSVSELDGFSTIAVLAPNANSYQDTTVAGGTQYYYKVRAINKNGESAYDRNGTGIGYSYYETNALTNIPDFSTLTAVKTGRSSDFSLGMEERAENFAVQFDGTIIVPSSGNYKFFTTSDAGSRLYINGSSAVNNDGIHSAAEKASNNIALTAGVAVPIKVTYFEATGSKSLSVSYQKTSASGTAVNKQVIPANVLGQPYVTVTTPDAPPPPAAPTGLNATAVTASSVSIAWTNNDANTTSFEIYRSYGDNLEYVLYTTVGAASTSYTDGVLFANSSVFYKVRAKSATGTSDYSNEINVFTSGLAPSLDSIADQFVHFGTQLQVPVNASITSAENLTLQVTNLPAFASFAVTGNGKGVITFNPATTDQGTFNGITVSVFNAQNNTTTRSFNLTVTDNYIPVVTGQNDVMVPENQNQELTLNATDNDEGDVLTWSFTGLPGFVTVTPNNRTVQLNIAPVSGNAGIYNVVAKADDGRNGTSTLALTITVNVQAAAISTYIHLSPSTSYQGGGVWNSISKVLGPNEVYPALVSPGFKNQNGVATEVHMSINFEAGLTTIANYSGVNTGSNTGVYPDKVLQAGYKFGWNKPYIISFSGLQPGNKYKFTFLGSLNTTGTGDISTKYRINSDSVLLNASKNTENTVTISNVSPNPDGTVSINIIRGPANASAYYYINSVVITDDGGTNTLPPGKPSDFKVLHGNSVAKLSWINTASLLTSNEIYRATTKAGPYTLLNTGGATTQSYNDSTVQVNNTYYYFVKANNNYGGTSTDTLSINTATTVSVIPVYIHLSPSTAYAAGGVWNSVNKILAPNEIFPASANPGFKDQNGVAGDVRLSINFEAGLTTIPNYSGMNTGANSGIYPDKVLQAGYKFGWNKPYIVSFSGLQPGGRYNFTFLGSSNTTGTGDISTKYRINSDSVLLNSNKNTLNTVTISNVTPNPDGTASVNISKGPANASAYYYINAILISDGGGTGMELPGKPSDFKVLYDNGAVKLSWTNTASVLTSNEVYRATAKAGPYALLNASGPTSQLYNDTVLQVNSTYYYYVKANNDNGGVSSDTLSILVPNKPPVISDTEAFLKTNQTTNIAVQATDNPGDVITLTASGLPPFVTFTDNGSGGGILSATPLAGNIGLFTATVTATDNAGESTSAVVKLYITDNAISSTYVNFNVTIPVAGIWNSFNKVPVANATLTGLKNDLGVATTAAVTLTTAWVYGTTGAVTGNNSGVFRDDVTQTYYAETSTAIKTVRITGLSTDASIHYNLVFMSSSSSTDDRTTIFSSGGKTVSINAGGNTQNTVQLNDLVATNGVLEYTVNKGATSGAAYMNAVVIQAYTSSNSLLAPDKFKAAGIAKDSVKLVWNNRASGGTVEIYRSTSVAGPFNYVTAVSGTTTTYADFGLQAGTEYFYKLKAVSSPNVSPFSNTISASTYAYSVFINFNRDNPAALPWNNTNSDPQSGAVYSFLYTDQKNYSGMSMTVGDGFSGTNANGENTGNNSGVVPDNVMRSVWWVDIGQTAQIKFSGLSQNMSYSFNFFASRTAVDTRITQYIINGRVVKLQVNSNRTRTVTMDNVYADDNGEVVLTIKPDVATGYSYIGGLIISGAKKPSDPIEGTEGAVFRSSDGSAISGEFRVTTPSTKSNLNVYPNPFTDDVMVKLNLANTASKLVIKVTDASGRMVLTREYSDVKKGSWLQAVGLDKQKLPAGVYFIQVQGINGETLTPIRVLKTK
jgi:large repetitive protein